MAKKRSKGESNGMGDVIPEFLRDAVLARLDDPASREKWPNLMKCVEPVFEGATLRRQAGRITIKVSGPNLLMTVSNPSEIIDIDIVVTSLTTAFDEMEQALSTGNFHTKPSWQKNKKKPPTILDDLV